MLVVIDLINKQNCYFDNVERPDSALYQLQKEWFGYFFQVPIYYSRICVHHFLPIFWIVMQRDIFTDFANVMGHDEAADCVMFGV